MKTSFSHLQQIFIVALFAFCLFFLGGGAKTIINDFQKLCVYQK